MPLQNKNGNTLFGEVFPSLEKPFIQRNTVNDLRNLCLREGISHDGNKPDLVARIVEVVEEGRRAANAAVDAAVDPFADTVVGVAEGGHEEDAPLPDVLTEEEVTQRLGAMSATQQDLLVGQHLRPTTRTSTSRSAQRRGFGNMSICVIQTMASGGGATTVRGMSGRMRPRQARWA